LCGQLFRNAPLHSIRLQLSHLPLTEQVHRIFDRADGVEQAAVALAAILRCDVGRFRDDEATFLQRLAQDILRVQTAYAELLNDYIHSKRKFLNDGETAEQFVRYLQAAKSRNSVERVQSSGSMQMSHEVYGGRLCESYVFDSLGAFLYVDFFRGLERNSLPRRCDNCGRYFLLSSGKYSNYCERPLEDDPGKTCRDVGTRRRYDDKCKTDPIWLAYNRAYKAHYARYMKNHNHRPVVFLLQENDHRSV
jgi:hypothetical protein